VLDQKRYRHALAKGLFVLDCLVNDSAHFAIRTPLCNHFHNASRGGSRQETLPQSLYGVMTFTRLGRTEQKHGQKKPTSLMQALSPHYLMGNGFCVAIMCAKAPLVILHRNKKSPLAVTPRAKSISKDTEETL
jgi:hypothetical protein